ncbi:MAG: succinate dehydrogenase, hydrophobic membrane anchor protein [Gammaproteobacteria bacterium CG22_combo_CG10-13_8_21_14_all_40_8]|nr:MAG: succinate dehydrogenase, hydrophobic membrane anchor protein [Gammaproteobacteria bacterium CG22_combo_CG10-13_8_21_14_all_40_8]
MVKVVTGFGRSGLHDWFMQRLSAVVLAVFTLYIAYFLLSTPNLTRDAWTVLFHNNFFRVVATMAMFATVVHAWIGLWTVATDYIKPTSIRLVFQSFVILFILGNLIWGVQILWGF